ncbi:hypothetical protein AC579_8651 [Pseudocercospora musae]|uniref:Uncharacterized protein n=1 Tax=Pseudocercospora musae TaxID=113226 RepID=A0A139I5Z9_9PEZI|nr:hypothetical protein AC579_8651 [Pseudocercospora musae]
MATLGMKRASAGASMATKINKYTVQPTGFWGRVHKFFALDPSRSSGVPLNPHFRNPPPGGNDPLEYTDPVTVPAGDLAENPYWKRDVRRSYPKLSVVSQSDVVGLLTVGSAAAPKDDVLKIGDAGKTQLVEVKEEGERGLATYFRKNSSVAKGVLGPDGLPPLPTSRHPKGKRYELVAENEQTYVTLAELSSRLEIHRQARSRRDDLVKLKCTALFHSSHVLTHMKGVMAPPATESRADDGRDTSILEIIFSCGICQATVSDLYATPEEDRGFSSDPGSAHGIIIKLWVGECSHVFCGKHLEGGAAPFHPKGRPPRAACPICVQDSDDSSMREIFGIRGLEDGQYDQVIPRDYFRCPPRKLDANDPGMDALRFQYTHLVRQAKQSFKGLRAVERKCAILESTLSKERKLHRKVETQAQELQRRHEVTTARLQKWENRKDVIKHYMNAVQDMTLDIQMMRDTLTELGYNVPQKRYGLDPPGTRGRSSMAPSKTAVDSSATLVEDERRSSSSRKRKMSEYDPYTSISGKDRDHAARVDDAQIMMAPPLPKQRLRRSEESQSEEFAEGPIPGSAQHGHIPSSQAFVRETRHALNTRSELHHQAPEHSRQPLQMSQMDTVPRQQHTDPLVRRARDVDENVRHSGALAYSESHRQPLLAQPPRRRSDRESQGKFRDPSYADYPTSTVKDQQPFQIPHHASMWASAAPMPGEATGRFTQHHQEHGTSLGRIGDIHQRSHVMPTTSHRTHPDPPASSAASPFFDRGARSSRDGGPLRAHALRNRMPPPRIAPLRHSDNGQPSYSYTEQSSAPFQAPHRTSMNSLSFIQTPHDSTNHQRLDAPERLYQDISSRYQREPVRSNMSLGINRRPEVQLPSETGSYAPLTASQPHRNRMTLPPASSKSVRYRGNHDSQISMVRGVRQSGPSRGTYSGQSTFPANYQPRSLISAMGNRRVVLR